jgi:serine/threonine protein phosphatase 1
MHVILASGEHRVAATLTCAVGDIHGCHPQLVRLLGHCERFCGASAILYVFLGDYIDRGPQSRDVVSHLIAAQQRAPERLVCLRGNHEDMAVGAAGDFGILHWLSNGGGATLRSYRADDVSQLPADHLAWFKRLPYSYDDGKRFFVHAGITPGLALDRQSPEAMLWIREPFLSDRRDHGRYIVHGHTPIMGGQPELEANRLNLDTGACFGGPLTAAVFDDSRIGPLAFITDDGSMVAAPDVCTGRAGVPIVT